MTTRDAIDFLEDARMHLLVTASYEGEHPKQPDPDSQAALDMLREVRRLLRDDYRRECATWNAR